MIKSIRITLIALACAFCGFAAYARSVPAEQVYNYARHRDYTALKYLGSGLEAEDCDGNTAVCLALKNGDRNAYSLLVSYGANPHPRCERRLSLKRYDPKASSVGISSTTWLMAAALVAGGVGIAVAAAGKGSGGSKGGGNVPDQHGNCDGYMSECSIGYVETGKTCRGYDGKTYLECVPADCTGYNLGVAPENCEDYSTCRSGTVTTFKCNKCKEGWHGPTCEEPDVCPYHTTYCALDDGYIETGNECYEGNEKYIECQVNPCTGYDLVPPHNMETCNNFSTCRSGNITKYRCEACNEGWNGTTCNNKNVCSYHTTQCILDEGYISTGNICYEGDDKFIECAPRDCSDYPFYKEPTAHCQISESCKPGEEQLRWRCAECVQGWEGEDCSIPHQCPYETTECLESRGYVETGNVCWSGDNRYVECKPIDCSDYPLKEIPENCATSASCRSAEVTTYVCSKCKEGWEGEDCTIEHECPYETTECIEEEGYVETGNVCFEGYNRYIECMPNPCDGFTLSKCPDAAECTTCQSGEDILYKVKQCPEGWTGVDCSVPKECEGFTLECEEGYVFPQDGETCRYGDVIYKKCEPRVCRPEYKYLECPEGYDEKDTCQSGDTIYKECEEHLCQFHTLECPEGYVETGNTCQSGDQTYVECAITGDCSAFTLETCPAHAQDCASCKSGETIRYQITKCYPGWEGTDCNEPKTCPFNTLSCELGQVPGRTCESGGKTYVECTNVDCGEGFIEMPGCPEDKAQTCEKCVSGGKDYYKITSCREGWTSTENYCEDPVDCNSKGYNLLVCPEHADCHHCMSGTTKWLQIYACAIGYTQSGNECVENSTASTMSASLLTSAPRNIGAYYSADEFEHTEDIALSSAENVTAIGVYADKATVINNARIEITKPLIAENADDAEIAEDESRAVKDEPEIIEEETAESPVGYAIGMYATSGSTIVNQGEIAIDSAQIAIGMYGEDGSEEAPTVVENAGTIEITSSEKAYGIWAEGENVIVKNTGTIRIDGTERSDECTGADCGEASSAIVLNGGVLFQNGLLQAQSFDTADVDGTVEASSDARFEIENEFSGDLVMSSEVVTDGFDDTYTVENMIDAGDVSGLNLLSQSALFDAELQNESDAVLTMKPFDEVVQNQSVAEFLKQNYDAGNNEELFNLLKEKDSLVALNAAINALTADDVFNRFNFEDMTMMRELNADVNDKLFNDKSAHLTTSGSVAPFYFESGMGSNARYALYNTRIGRKSVGLSLALSNVNSRD
ncbi:MAG: hypothetical protein IKR92_04335, partial [Alphaproteobacteria bacterium]|nr:hypothetical protein [Alphaproteobacteria bacterium]